jgi:hypothetical protein
VYLNITIAHYQHEHDKDLYYFTDIGNYKYLHLIAYVLLMTEKHIDLPVQYTELEVY